LGVLGHHAEVSVGFKRIKHQNDVLVVQLPQDTDLLSEILYVLLTLAVLINELHGNRESSILPASLKTNIY